jgi:transcriptional regulator with XRE-family HTH domain
VIAHKEAKEILKQAGVKQKALSRATGINSYWVCEYLNGRRILDDVRLQRIESYIEKVKGII